MTGECVRPIETAIPPRSAALPGRKPSRRVLRSLCGEVGPGDGLDPRLEPRGAAAGKGGRKARQLCAQVAETLNLALASSPDDLLAGLTVVAVEPAPDSSRLLATVAPPAGERPDPSDLMDHLERASARLRSEVARAITRKKAPALAFRISLT